MNGSFDSMSDDPCGPGSDCAKILEVVDKYIDGCADENESSLITSHASGCPDCKEGIEFDEKFRARVMAVQPECMPDEFKEKLLMSLGFPGMNEMHSSVPGSGEHAKHSFFKFFRKNGHTSGD
jgi:hypothetical protein